MKLVFATHNPHKLAEIKKMMPHFITLESLTDIGCHEDIAETAETIAGNAALKANHVNDKYHKSCFADDTGLKVDALNGDPGIYSARYAGNQKDNEANIKKLLDNLKGIQNRKAHFKTVISLRTASNSYLFEGICPGSIVEAKRGTDGFGYDPVFLPEGATKTFAEMGSEEKAKISHRGIAFRKLIDDFLQENHLEL